MSQRPTNVLVLAGGTGGNTTLQALRTLPTSTVRLTGLAPGSDSGGSSEIIRRLYHCPAPGDARNHMAALATEGEDLNKRFGPHESNPGHTHGNLQLAKAFLETGDMDQAIQSVGQTVGMIGAVHLVSLDPVDLYYRRIDGTLVVGEDQIIQTAFHPGEIPDLFLDPTPTLNPAAAAAIAAADVIIVGPGNVFGSLLPIFMVPGVKEALAISTANKVYICNLVTTVGQTDGFQVHDFVTLIGRSFAPDVVIYNNGPTSQAMHTQYAKERQHWVSYDLEVLHRAPYQAIGAPLLSETPIERIAGDPLGNSRNVLRHNIQVLGDLFRRLI